MATPRQQNHSRFQRGSGAYTCRICKHQTRATGGDGATNGSCDLCWDLAGEENHIMDHGGKTYDSKENVTAMLAALDKRNGAGTARKLFEDVCDAVDYDKPKAADPAVSRILNPSQAKAVYDAMCALNNVGGTALAIQLPEVFYRIEVSADVDGTMHIKHGPVQSEGYADQASFAAAYGLN